MRDKLKQNPIINAMSVDVEDYFQVAAFDNVISPHQWDNIPLRVEENTNKIPLPVHYGRLDPARHFVARAKGNSMDGGKNPIMDGDYLLLEMITPESAGSISSQIVAIERQDVSGDDQYLLRYVHKWETGKYELIANNPDFQPMMATEDMRTFARFKGVIDSNDLVVEEGS